MQYSSFYSTIFNLPTIDTLQSGDLFAVGDVSNSDTRKVSLAVLLAYMQANITVEPTGVFTTQYASPLTGTTLQIDDNSNNTHAILTPATQINELTIRLPAFANLVDKQEIIVTCTRQVNNLTMDINGAANIFGVQQNLSAEAFFRIKYDAGFSNWHRIG